MTNEIGRNVDGCMEPGMEHMGMHHEYRSRRFAFSMADYITSGIIFLAVSGLGIYALKLLEK